MIDTKSLAKRRNGVNESNPIHILTLSHQKYIGLCEALVGIAESLRDQNQTLGVTQTHWGTFPQTPFIKLPNPSILEGLPRRLASPKRIVLRNCQEDDKSAARVHSLMLLSWISTNRCTISVRLPWTLTIYLPSPNSRFASYSNCSSNPQSYAV